MNDPHSSRAAQPDAVRWGPDGLVPAIAQDVADGRVLMLAWQDREALAATLRTGEAHFHSRSRNRLWRKGETSGNVLRIRSATLDCDGDAILLAVEPTGPACHTGARSCFDAVVVVEGERSTGSPTDFEAGKPRQGFAWLETLWATIAERSRERPAGSHTARLLDGGVDVAARKVGEEAVEVVLAAKDHALDPSAQTEAAFTGEVADLVFHALVLCAERGVAPATVVEELQRRHRPSSRA